MIQVLTSKVGFQFNEAELSPSIRQKIGELAITRQQLDNNQSQYDYKWRESLNLTSEAKKSKTWSMVALIAGLSLAAFGALGVVAEASLPSSEAAGGTAVALILFLIPGLVIAVYGYVRWTKARESATRLQIANHELASLRDQTPH